MTELETFAVELSHEAARTALPFFRGEFARAVDPDPKHAHVVFETEAGGRVTYYDPRRFGFMGLIETATLAKLQALEKEHKSAAKALADSEPSGT